MNQTNELYALITGASEGIGKAISEELASRGHNLLLVALPDEKLEVIAAQLKSTYSIKVHYLGIDLTTPDSDKAIHDWSVQNGRRVNILINNAGYGFLGAFEKYDRDFYRDLMQINMITVVGLSRLFIDELKSHKNSHLLNIGSIASFYPMPFKIVYAASKYFIYSFSRALREELKKTTVGVSLLCPGAVVTNHKVIERINQAGKLGKMSSNSPEFVAKVAVRKMLKNRVLIIPGISAKMSYYLEKVVPTLIKQKVLSRGFNSNSSD